MEKIQKNFCIENLKILDGTSIKIIAVILMFLDHIYQMFYWKGAPEWLTILGRPVFVMFLFLSAEAFHYTKDKRKYLTRLLFSSWIMLAISKFLQFTFPNPNVVLMNNAFSTFFMSALYMRCWDWFVEGIRKKNIKCIFKSIFVALIPIVSIIPILLGSNILFSNSNISLGVIRFFVTIMLFIPNILFVEGGFIFVLMGLLFYIFREKRLIQIIVLFIISIISFIYGGNNIQWVMCFGFIPMLLYNGKRGVGMKNFFYIFYPLHIWILYIISTILI